MLFKNTTIHVFLFCLLSCNGLEMDHWGTNFVLSFLRNVDNAANRIVVTARELTDVTITFHEGTGDTRVFQLLAGESRTETFGFDSTAYPPLTVLMNKAITVESTAQVSVYGLSYVKRSTDGFLALPTPSLGMDYMAVNIDDDRSQIVIVAVQDNTNVKVTLKTETNNACWEDDNWYYYNDGVVLEFNMMSHDVVNVYCSRETTGSRIESNKPIAVLSGNKCASLPDLALCDHVVEMLPPIAEFGLEFVVPAPSGQRYGAMLRVVALYDVTSFDIKGTNHNIDSRRYTDVKLSQSDVFCFTSNKPVLVVLFMIGKDDDNHDDIYDGDAFLMLIPPVNKYTTEYVFKGNLLGYYTNKAMIIAHRDDTNYISPSVSAFEIIANCDYRVKTVLVNNVKTVTSTKPFAVLQYGYEFREAYGFPAGMRITSYDDPTTPSLTTQPVTTDPPTTVPITTAPLTTDSPTMDYITTDPPTTDPPTTNPPTTHPTTIDPPTTEPITTEPTTAVPSTESATTAVPSTESPTTEHSTDTPTAAELQTTENPTAANKPNLPKPCSGAYCLCTCPCVKKKRTFSDSLMYAQIQQKYIHVQKDQLSKTKRIKHSSANISQSEANLGLSSVLVIIILFSGFIFLDISRVFVWCYNRRRKTTTGKISPKKYKDKKLIFTSQ